MQGWKVIDCGTRESARASDWPSNTKYTLIYPQNCVVDPKDENSYLLFFDTYDNALAFSLPHEQVVSCVAYKVYKFKYLCRFVESIPLFWRLKKQKKSTQACSMVVPKGTLFAKAIKCLT